MAESPEACTTTLPAIAGWPYARITLALLEFQESNKNPKILWVGPMLWCILREVSDAEEFYSVGACKIQPETTGILEPNEFMFSHE